MPDTVYTIAVDQTKGIHVGEYLAELHHTRPVRVQFCMFPYPPLSPFLSRLSEAKESPGADNVKPAKKNKG